MGSHKFAAGDRVAFVPGSLDGNVRRGIYTVVRALPATGPGLPQYRVKHVDDTHERVIDEAQLRPAAPA